MYNIVIYITVKMNTEHHYLVVIISVTDTGICYNNHWTKYSDVHAVCNIVIIGIVAYGPTEANVHPSPFLPHLILY